ncbi:putative uncharacterized protein DDB_G0282133 [Panonychus citri]|uniref:putative uncharacterized protein DDB_G0282133 n=1 Tax=Panonychus citri TaxID=50023 RepID=UPI002307B554|nr:putative uncharacterized protein DDB_G0282133 [Panonychus citri]
MGLSSSKDEFKSISVTDYDSEILFDSINNNNNQLNHSELLVKSPHEILVDHNGDQLITGSTKLLSSINCQHPIESYYNNGDGDLIGDQPNQKQLKSKLFSSETNHNNSKLFPKDLNEEMNDFLHLFNSNQTINQSNNNHQNHNNLFSSPVTLKSENKLKFFNSNQRDQIRFPIMDQVDIVGELNCHKPLTPSDSFEEPVMTPGQFGNKGAKGRDEDEDDDVTVDIKSEDDNKKETDQVISEINQLLSEPDDLLTPSPYTWRRGRSLGNIIDDKNLINHSSSSDRSMDSLLKNYQDNQINLNCDDPIDYPEKSNDHLHPPSLNSSNVNTDDQLESIEDLICKEMKTTIKSKIKFIYSD